MGWDSVPLSPVDRRSYREPPRPAQLHRVWLASLEVTLHWGRHALESGQGGVLLSFIMFALIAFVISWLGGARSPGASNCRALACL